MGSAAVGDLITYTVTVKNPTSEALSVTVAELFPDNVLLVAAAGDSSYPESSGTSLDSPPPAGYNPLLYIEVGEVPAGSSVDVVVTVRVLGSASGSDLLTYAQVGIGDAVLAPATVTCPAGFASHIGLPEGSCAITSVARSAFTVTKNVCASDVCDVASGFNWASSAARPAGGRALWRLTVTNTGATELTDVTVSDAELGSSVANGGIGKVSGALWEIGILPPGASVLLAFETVVPSTGTTIGTRSVASANAGLISTMSAAVRLTGQPAATVAGLADTGALPGRLPAVLTFGTMLVGLLMLIPGVRRRRTVRV
jgi:uncharacterized repeat protein (TIGR01451 family)